MNVLLTLELPEVDTVVIIGLWVLTVDVGNGDVVVVVLIVCVPVVVVLPPVGVEVRVVEVRVAS